MVEHFDEWKKGMKRGGREIAENKDWDACIKEGNAIRDLYPDYVEEHSVYEMLADAYLAKGDKAGGDRRNWNATRRSAGAIRRR